MTGLKEQNETFYLGGLNGIRAIAAIGVLVSHINLALNNFGVYNYSIFGFKNGKPLSWTLGEQAVTMFFVLSGFLITYLLRREIDKKGKIDTKAFYLRRILRIWPLYFFFMALSITTVYLTQGSLPSSSSLFFYLFLMANVPFIFGETLPASGHLWSIAVEEQFYLFWPFFFKRKISLVKVLLVLISVQIIFRLFVWLVYPFTELSSFVTVNRFDCMMFGGLIAILLDKKSIVIDFLSKKYSQVFAWFVIFVHVINFEFINSIISIIFVVVATGTIICGQVNSKSKIINLEKPYWNFVGKYSFGIYVYHPLIIYIFFNYNLIFFIENEVLKMVMVFISIIVLTLVVSYFSYEYFENRFLKLKHNFSVVKSTNVSQSKSK